ncbi:hypothetical protein C8R44DRAFT_891317 [Mycena epipterygia]|nr:hypothetical protein C8R44DRAFT_891317 [Mycena epipterygia]
MFGQMIDDTTLHIAICHAANTALTVLNKYYSFTDDSKIYQIAMNPYKGHSFYIRGATVVAHNSRRMALPKPVVRRLHEFCIYAPGGRIYQPRLRPLGVDEPQCMLFAPAQSKSGKSGKWRAVPVPSVHYLFSVSGEESEGAVAASSVSPPRYISLFLYLLSFY